MLAAALATVLLVAGGCGGYAIIWAPVGGSWREVWGGQENPGCEEMTRLGVPAAIAGDTCFDGEGEVPYKP
ncbi:MAG: hypothetical protein ACR2FE_10775 [Aeromicrobium sp.]